MTLRLNRRLDADRRAGSPFRAPIALAVTFVVLSAGSVAAGAERTRYAYPGSRLTVVDGVAVYATFLGPQTRLALCPRNPLPLSSADVREAARTVAAAMPALYARMRRPGTPRVDARGATASAGRSAQTHAGTSFRTVCGETVWRRSAFVAVRLPRVRFSSSLAHPSFHVARTRLGWIVWAQVH
jgi:hypothetical protein